jgi:EF hand
LPLRETVAARTRPGTGVHAAFMPRARQRRYNLLSMRNAREAERNFPARKRLMMTRRKMAAALAGASFAFIGTSFAQDTANVPKYPDKLAIAEANSKQLLLLMDTDKNGKISKQEWMKFMSAEFDRLDTDHSGELDPHELLQSDITVERPRPSDLGK